MADKPDGWDRLSDEEVTNLLTNIFAKIRGVKPADLDQNAKTKIAQAVAKRNLGELRGETDE